MKKILIITILLFVSLSANAEMTLEGGVKYNIDSAREELKYTPIPQPNPIVMRENFYDKNMQDNVIQLLKGKARLKDREIAFFSDNTYGVIYNKNKQEVFYYDATGELMFMELRDSLTYPYKSYKYNLNGQLVNMGLRVSKEETFIYKPDGTLIAHWIRGLGFDTNGKVIMKRKYIE